MERSSPSPTVDQPTVDQPTVDQPTVDQPTVEQEVATWRAEDPPRRSNGRGGHRCRSYRAGAGSRREAGGTAGRHRQQPWSGLVDNGGSIRSAPGYRPGTVADAAACPMVALAVPWASVPSAVDGLNWAGEIVIDATNAVLFPSLEPAPLGGVTSSEIVAKLVSGAWLVKAANTLGADLLGSDPEEGRGRRVLFVSGDHQPAKDAVVELFDGAGFFTIDLGDLVTGGVVQQGGGPLSGPQPRETSSILTKTIGESGFASSARSRLNAALMRREVGESLREVAECLARHRTSVGETSRGGWRTRACDRTSAGTSSRRD